MIRLVLMLVILALAVGCRRAGPSARAPATPPPCLLRPPVDPGPILEARALCVEAGDCQPMTAAEQELYEAALWAYIESIEDYAARAWRRCGPNPVSEVP
jgi:hypothetical protein